MARLFLGILPALHQEMHGEASINNSDPVCLLPIRDLCDGHPPEVII